MQFCFDEGGNAGVLDTAIARPCATASFTQLRDDPESSMPVSFLARRLSAISYGQHLGDPSMRQASGQCTSSCDDSDHTSDRLAAQRWRRVPGCGSAADHGALRRRSFHADPAEPVIQRRQCLRPALASAANVVEQRSHADRREAQENDARRTRRRRQHHHVVEHHLYAGRSSTCIATGRATRRVLRRRGETGNVRPSSTIHRTGTGYSFAVPESVARGELRPLRNPADGGR